MMAFALLESLAVTGILALAAALLPQRWLRDGFGYKGFVLLLIATADAILLQKLLDTVFPSPWTLLLVTLVPLALSVIVLAVLRSRPGVQNLLVQIQDRFLVVLFLYLPIGVISILAVTVRNLL